jgi:DNA-binding CsgD family transcriptional regulator
MPKKLILTERQAQALDAIVELGQTDLAARKLGLSIKTIEAYVSRAMIANKYPNRLTLAIARDRELRSL